MTFPLGARTRIGSESAGQPSDSATGGARGHSPVPPTDPAPVRGYRLIAELLLHPAERDERAVESDRRDLPEIVRHAVDRFLAAPASRSADEYVHTLELSPPCPLYLGAYLFDEPESCRGAALSERNAYMLDLTGLYRHFGFELDRRELPDYLPVVVEFLGLSAGTGTQLREARLRRFLLESYVAPALPPLHAKLATYESPYAALVEALEALVRLELERLEGVRPWEPEETGLPVARAVCRDRLAVRLPVLPSGTPATDPSTEGS